MTEYSSPPTSDVTAAMTPEEATLAKDGLMGAASQDREHPFLNSGHPQHKGFVDYTTALYRRISEGDAVAAEAEKAQRAADVEAGATAEQVAVRASAQVEIDQLVELGYTETDLPKDIEPWHVESLKMQRLAAQGDYENLTPLLSKSLRDLNTPPDMLTLVDSFTRLSGMDAELKADLAERLVRHVHEANKQLAAERKAAMPWLK